jgi:hypothetical protein
MSDSTPPSPESWFHEVATHYVEAQALFHLNRSGVFEALDSGGASSAPALAESLGLQLEPLSTLLDYVVGVGRLLQRDEQGRYGFTAWGLEVLDRYGRLGGDGRRSFNFFDVRVGAYGPVWAAMGGLLRGEERYGETLTRAGGEAAEGVYKIGGRFAGALGEIVDRLGASMFVEIGVTSGLAARVGATRPKLGLAALDRDSSAITTAAARAADEGVDRIRWIEADLFDLDAWTGDLQERLPGVITTVHFHELMAAGEERLIALLSDLAERLPGWHVIALEQPLLPASEREETSETLWRYNHSNVLIHHLIGNGRILSHVQWLALFARAGVEVVDTEALNYLGYQAYTLSL